MIWADNFTKICEHLIAKLVLVAASNAEKGTIIYVPTLTSVHAICFCYTAQQIFPTIIQGQVGDNVTFGCISTLVGEAVNNNLEIYRPDLDVFASAEDLPRVRRMNDLNNPSLTNYTFGPLMSTDNGAIFHCTSGSDTGNATISVICKPLLIVYE